MLERFRLDGRVALVTGALGRLGPVWAQSLASAGATVVGLDHADAPANARFEGLRAGEGAQRLGLLRADVRDRGSLEAARRACEQSFGAPEILVNNAGIDQPPSADARLDRIEDLAFEAGRDVLEVNTLGAFQVIQVFAPAMLAARRGSIINVGSLYATVAPDAALYDHLRRAPDPPFLKPPMYGASKAALVNLTKYLAVLWGPRGVRVNAISPGGVQGGQDSEFQRKYNERVPLGRMAREEDLTGPLLFLASDASSYVTGFDLRVDGGFASK